MLLLNSPRSSDRSHTVAEIPRVIHLLCTAPPDVQRAAIETYFTSAASFTHPFCRTGSFPGSIWFIVMIYRWYKILSPHIDVAVDGVAFDEQNLRLYVSLHQNFKLWVVPFYNAPVKLVTVLQLTTDRTPTHIERRQSLEPLTPSEVGTGQAIKATENSSIYSAAGNDEHTKQQGDGEKMRYWIQSQNDLYQTTEWIKFLLPWGVGVLLLVIWQFYCTLLCVVGTQVYDTLVWIPRKLYRQHFEVFDNDNTKHPHLGAD
ncbi:hypothetical protein CLCR_10674 [Cladophialophora carrionii]|uniref:SigF-like NTF2-like domain-containing protein n=1 Tax=Cladophialophora carrionii TaxID=86049 RepID=A0A1C1CYJ2_9EURO|nr:hypothetical protein CLCR_10674 [Cladophialophora carrionii]